MNITFPNNQITSSNLSERELEALSRLGTNIQFHEAKANDITPESSQDNGNITIDGKHYFLGYINSQGIVMMKRKDWSPLKVPLIVCTSESNNLRITTEAPSRIAVKHNGNMIAIWDMTKFHDVESPVASSITVGHNDANGWAHGFFKLAITKVAETGRFCILDGKITPRATAAQTLGIKYYKLMQFLKYSRDNSTIIIVNNHSLANHSGIIFQKNPNDVINTNIPKPTTSQQKAVLMYMKRNPGKTTPSKKWTEAQILYFETRLQKQHKSYDKLLHSASTSLINIFTENEEKCNNSVEKNEYSEYNNTVSVCSNELDKTIKSTDTLDPVYLDFINNRI